MESAGVLLKKDLSFCLELRCDKRVTKALDDYERCNYGQVLVTELKKCYEEENSDKQNECNLKTCSYRNELCIN